jgi:GT2 family glycosyltransferase
MLSIIILARNVRKSLENCLQSLQISVYKAGLDARVEYILVDDASDAGLEVAPAMVEFRGRTRAPVKILRFIARQHYSKAMAHALSVAAGDAVLFVSHDMIVPVSYLRTILAVAAMDKSFGIVRGTSTYVDCFPQHIIKPPMPPRSLDDIFDFSDFVARYYGLAFETDALLTGDSMLIQRAVLDKIGVFDSNYYGYFGDIDFGLRAQRAGFKMVCAKGAWLLHEGAAFYKQQGVGTDGRAVHDARMKVVNAAYMVFRDKWDTTLPPEYQTFAQIDYTALARGPAPTSGEFEKPVLPDAAICQML